MADQSEAPAGRFAGFDTRRVRISHRELLFWYKHSFNAANICCRGGMRGIAELEVLKAIQEHLPRGIPIHMFFDLIVGTRYGTISLGPICGSTLTFDSLLCMRLTFSQHRRYHSFMPCQGLGYR